MNVISLSKVQNIGKNYLNTQEIIAISEGQLKQYLNNFSFDEKTSGTFS